MLSEDVEYRAEAAGEQRAALGENDFARPFESEKAASWAERLNQSCQARRQAGRNRFPPIYRYLGGVPIRLAGLRGICYSTRPLVGFPGGGVHGILCEVRG